MSLTFEQRAAIGTSFTFQGSGGDAVITLANLGFGVGRVSAQLDLGAVARPALFEVVAKMQWEDNPAATDTAEVVIVSHDGTVIPGGLGSADAAVTVYAKLGQIVRIPLIVSAEAAAGSTDRIAQGTVWLPHRYASAVVWNRSGTKNLKNTANVSLVRITSIIETMVRI